MSRVLWSSLWDWACGDKVKINPGNWLKVTYSTFSTKVLECVSFLLCWVAVLSESSGFPVGGSASEMTLAMMGVASPAPAHPKRAKTQGSQLNGLWHSGHHNIGNEQMNRRQWHTPFNSSPCVATVWLQNFSRQVWSQKCLTSPSKGRLCFSFPLHPQVSHLATWGSRQGTWGRDKQDHFILRVVSVWVWVGWQNSGLRDRRAWCIWTCTPQSRTPPWSLRTEPSPASSRRSGSRHTSYSASPSFYSGRVWRGAYNLGRGGQDDQIRL